MTRAAQITGLEHCFNHVFQGMILWVQECGPAGEDAVLVEKPELYALQQRYADALHAAKAAQAEARALRTRLFDLEARLARDG